VAFFASSGCSGKLLGNLTDGGGQYAYDALGGAVPFYVMDMINAQRWLRADQIDPMPKEGTFIKDALAKHICSYSCWLSQSLNQVRAGRSSDQPEQHVVAFH
jgi:hypothetical protein